MSLQHILKLLNFRDLFLVFFLQLNVKYGYVNAFNFNTNFNNFHFVLLSTSMFLVLISGQLMRGSVQHSDIIKNKKKIFIVAFILYLISVILTSFMSYELEKTHYLVVFLISHTLIVYLSYTLETHSFGNNLFTSLLISYVILTVWFLNEPDFMNSKDWKLFAKLEVVIVLTAILCFITQLIRSVLSSLRSLKKNQEITPFSLPMVYGEKKTKKILIFCSLSATLITVLVAIFYASSLFMAITLLYFAVVPPTLLINSLRYVKSPKGYKKIISDLDIVLFTGILAIPLIAYIIKNVH